MVKICTKLQYAVDRTGPRANPLRLSRSRGHCVAETGNKRTFAVPPDRKWRDLDRGVPAEPSGLLDYE